MNQYQLTDEISKSEKSTVYKGRKRKAVEYYAIISIDKSRREGVLNWAQALRLFDHPNIIRFYNWYETSNHLWLITEYCAGGNLRSIFSEGAELNESCICAYAEDIAMGLLYMHKHGILCNDLHPLRLLLDYTATLRFYNFIQSCSFQSASEHPAIGVPLYMAPERFFGSYGLTSTASDLWALGCILYEMAAGEPPFDGNDLCTLMRNIFNKPVKRLVHASEEFNQLIAILLEKNPLKRATWKEVAASSYWENPLPLPTEGLPPEPALEAYRKLHGRKSVIWSTEEVERLIGCCNIALNVSNYNRNDMSEDASISALDLSKEQNFQTALTEESFFNKAVGSNEASNSNNNNNSLTEKPYVSSNNNNAATAATGKSTSAANEELVETTQNQAATKLPPITAPSRNVNNRNNDSNTDNENKENRSKLADADIVSNREEKKTTMLPSATTIATAAAEVTEKSEKQDKKNVMRAGNRAATDVGDRNETGTVKDNASHANVNKADYNTSTTNNKENSKTTPDAVNGKMKVEPVQEVVAAAATAKESNKGTAKEREERHEPHVQIQKEQKLNTPSEKLDQADTSPPVTQLPLKSIMTKQNDMAVPSTVESEENDRKSPSNAPRVSGSSRATHRNKTTEEGKRNTSLHDPQELKTSDVLPLSELIFHSSDAHIRPICMNNNIERFPRPTFRKDSLGFPPYTTETIVNMSNDELTEFIHTIYTRLSSSKHQEDRLNLMSYFLTLCTDTITATILVNSSVVPLCLSLAKPDSGSEAQRVFAVAIVGLLIRYATIVEADLASSGVVTALANLFSADSNIKVRRKLVAAIGEFMFYVVSQPVEQHSQWGVNADNVRRIFTFALQSDDEVMQHYAAKTIENVASTEEKSSLNIIFCTETIVKALMKIYMYQSKDGHNEHLRATTLCTAIKLSVMRPSLIHVVWNCPALSRRVYGTVLDTNDIPRTSQMLMTFINFAMLNALVSLKSPYVTYLTSPPRLNKGDGASDDYADVFNCESLQLQKSNTKVLGSISKSNSNLNNTNINGRMVNNTVLSTTMEYNYTNGNSNNRKRSVSAMNLKTDSSVKRSSLKPSLNLLPLNTSVGESSNFSGTMLTPMDSELARHVLKEMCDAAINIMDHVHHTGDHITPGMRGKVLLFVVLLGCCAGDTFARVCTSQYVSFMDRVIRDQDIYIRRCSAVLFSFISIFIREKLESIAQRISSSTTQLYLSAIQQLLGAATIRSCVYLPKNVFVSLQECLHKSFTSTLYSAYEDDFHTLVESIMRNTDNVVQHGDAVCEYLIKPYTEMLQGKESKRRFVALRFLMSVVSTMASNNNNNNNNASQNTVISNTAATKATSMIVEGIARILPSLLTAVNPTPTHTLRLLQTCAEWIPESMEPLATENVIRELIDWIANLSKLEPFCPIRLVSNILSLPNGRPELLRYVAVEEFTLLMSILLSAQEEEVESTIEDCCYLMMHAVENVKNCSDNSTSSSTPSRRNTINTPKKGENGNNNNNNGNNNGRRSRRNSSVQKANSSPTSTRTGNTRSRSSSKNDGKSANLSQMRTCCSSSCVRKILLPFCAFSLPTAHYAISIVSNLTSMFPLAANDLFSRDAAVLYVKLVKKSGSTKEYTAVLAQLLESMCTHVTRCEPHPEMLRSNSPFTAALLSTTKPPWSDVIRKRATELSKFLTKK